MDQDWMNNDALRGIDKEKLDMLSSLANKGSGKSGNDLLPFLMMSQANFSGKGKQFSQDEFDLIVNVLKTGKSPEETARMDQMLMMLRMMMH